MVSSASDDLLDLKLPIPDWLSSAMSVERTSQTLQVDGCPIHYFSWGAADLPGLVFLHGRLSHARCWSFVAPLLAQRYRCIAIDFSGMGDSGWRDAYSYQQRIQEVAAVVQASALAHPPMIVSHSYGAVIGVKVLQRFADRFAGLIACDPSLNHPQDWSTLTPRSDGAGLQRPHRSHGDLASAVSRFRFAPPQVCEQPVLQEYMARHSLKPVTDGWQWKFDPLVYSAQEQGHDDWWVHHTQDFVALPAPKALIYAAESDFISHRTVTAVAQRCASFVPTVEISHARHHLMADQPIALASAIDGMVSALSGLSASA